ncbi:ribulose-phosphate 3-epimerase [candidate division KSB1 bacterium]|nr:ribulose-phosphate 3-epimerase [candidate division KSB1 bacterium]
MRDKIIISPSVMSADFSILKEEIHSLEEGGADWLHIDVMDGHFVPNITFGPKIVRTINNLTDLTLDVHLMIENPENYLEDFRNAGADIITVHQEACPQIHSTIKRIKELGAKAGVSINPGTPVESIQEILGDVDLILIMSVNPGFGGQKFISSSVKKVETISGLLNSIHADPYLEIDGGIDETNAGIVTKAGCNVLVAGTGVFKNPNRSEGVKNLRAAALSK